MNRDVWLKKTVWRKFLTAYHLQWDKSLTFTIDGQNISMIITPIPYDDGQRSSRYQFRFEGYFSHLANFGNSINCETLMEAIPYLYTGVTYEEAEEIIALLLLQL